MRKFLMVAAVVAVSACGEKKAEGGDTTAMMAPPAMMSDSMMKADSMKKADSVMKADSMMKHDSGMMAPAKP